MKILDRLTRGDEHGIHYAVSIFFATAVLSALAERVTQSNPIWAISSMVATSDPLMKQAVLVMRARIINTVVGCLILPSIHSHRRSGAHYAADRDGHHRTVVVLCRPYPDDVAASTDQCSVRARSRLGTSHPARWG